MRISLACVAGAMLLQVTISPANAGQGESGGLVEKVHYVAPEPTPAQKPSAVDPGEPFVEEAAPDEAYAPGASFTSQAASSGAVTNTAVSPNAVGTATVGDFGWTGGLDCYADPYCGGCARCAACRMPPHYAYFPPMHGYYYFRPYNAVHVPTQQTFARMWGEDPANPYANRLFEMVYDQYRADKLAEQGAIEEQPVVE